MGVATGMELVGRFFSGTARTYDRVAALCTFGLDGRWKRRIIAAVPEDPRRILDQACGTGILTLRLARKFPSCHVTGVDVTPGYLAVAVERARVEGVTNVTFLEGRAEEVSPEPGFDCITSSYLAKYADLDRLVRNAGFLLRPGGTLIVHDFAYPSRPLYRFFWRLHFALLRTLGAAFYPEWKPAFDELPALIRETGWVNGLVERLERSGFSDVSVRPLSFGAAAIVTAQSCLP